MRVYERSEELRRKDERQTLAVEMVAIHLTAVFMVQYSARLRSTAQHSTFVEETYNTCSQGKVKGAGGMNQFSALTMPLLLLLPWSNKKNIKKRKKMTTPISNFGRRRHGKVAGAYRVDSEALAPGTMAVGSVFCTVRFGHVGRGDPIIALHI